MTTHSNNSNSKIDEALQLLNEAAREKKEELQHLLNNKYSHIKDTFAEVTMSNKELLEKLGKRATQVYKEGEERIEETLGDIDKEVRKNPWPYIAGTAAAALLLGYLMGNSRR